MVSNNLEVISLFKKLKVLFLSILSDLQIHKLTLYEMKERDSKNTSLHYRKPLPELPLIAVQSSLIMHCQG